MRRQIRPPLPLAAALRRLAADTRGGVLALSIVLLVFVLGTGGLILDFGRVWNSQSELQAFADHAALAAAGELDGTSDAIQRANDALDQLITDRQSYAAGDLTLDSGDLSATFLDGLPAADTDDDFGPFVTADPTAAQYVRVQVNPHTVSTIFAGILTRFAGTDQVDITTGAAAVAGYTQFVCDITPLMFCPPTGMDRETLRDWLPGRQIRLKEQGTGWGPGTFGLLDLNFDPAGPCGPPNTGANYFRCAVAVQSSITRCFARRGVDVRPGQVTGPVNTGLNTRFDVYTTSLKSSSNDPAFAPAPNVIKGFKGNGSGCVQNNPEPSNVAALPQEQCLVDETCPDGRFSSTQTVDAGQAADYVQQNYTDVGSADKTGGATSRYQMYMNEIANAAGGEILDTGAGLEESGLPTCSSAPPAGPERRVLVAAAVDCSTLSGGNASNVPVIDFYRIFLSNLAGQPDPQDVWVEVIDHIDPLGGGSPTTAFIHDFVQLYR